MDVVAFFICEKVVPRMDGSLDVLRFGPRSITLKAKNRGDELKTRVGIVCRLTFSPVEKGEKNLELAFMSPDGELLEQKSLDFNVPGKGLKEEADLHGEMPIRVYEPGDYVIVATLGGQEIARWPLRIKIAYAEDRN